MLGPCEAYLMKQCNCRSTVWLVPSFLFHHLFVCFSVQNTTTTTRGIKTRTFFIVKIHLLVKILVKEAGCWELIV